jgi:hypothetical protein
LGYKFAKDLTLNEAKKGADHIIGIIYEFVSSIEKVFPGSGYGNLANGLTKINYNIQNCKGPFLTNDEADYYVNPLLETFTRMHANIEGNLKKVFPSAYRNC